MRVICNGLFLRAAPAARAEPTAMEADGAPAPAAAGPPGAFDPAKKTIAELKAWLTEQGEENQARGPRRCQK